jgi:hypothetical protein
MVTFCYLSAESTTLGKLKFLIYAPPFLLGACLYFYGYRNITLSIHSRGTEQQPQYFLIQPSTDFQSTAILLHGKRCSSSMMLSVAIALAKMGLKTIAFDMPGHGQAKGTFHLDCPKSGYVGLKNCEDESIDLAMAITSVGKILKQEGVRSGELIVIGHSWGGRIAGGLAHWLESQGYSPKVINLDGREGASVYYDSKTLRITTNPDADRNRFRHFQRSHLGIIYDKRTYETIGNWIFPSADNEDPNSSFSRLPEEVGHF